MSITFPCDQCSQRYTVDPKLAGKKVKCKKCGKVLLIPVPRVVSTPVAAAPPAQKAEPDGHDRFGLSDTPDFLPEDDLPVAKVINRRGSTRGAGGRTGILEDPKNRYLLFGAGGAIGLVLIIALLFAFTGKRKETASNAPESPALAAHRKALKEGLAALAELNEEMAAISDESSAEAAELRIRGAVLRLQTLADRSKRLARLGSIEKQKFRAEALGETAPAMVKWQAEMERIRGLPAVASRLAALSGLVRLPE